MATPSTTMVEADLDHLPLLPKPNLLLDAEEIAARREQLKDPVHGAAFAALQARCDQLMDPENPEHPDWQTLKDPRWRLRAGLSFAVKPVEDLAMVDAMTGDQRYGDFAHGIVMAIIRNGLADVAYDYDWGALKEVTPYKGWRHNAGHDFGSLSRAFAVFYDFCGERMEGDDRAAFLAFAEECLTMCSNDQAEVGRMGLNNRGARCAIGNGLLALAVQPDLGSDAFCVRSCIRIALYTASAWSSFAIGIDGGSFEGVSYCQTTSIMQALLGRAMRRRGVRDLAKHPNLRRLQDFTLYNLTPTHEMIMPVNDCSRMICYTAAQISATIHRNGVHRWLYEEIREHMGGTSFDPGHFVLETWLYEDTEVAPVSPAEAGYPLARHFRDKGVVAAFSSWERDAAHALFFCGPHVYGGHRQDDELSFTFFAMGQAFAWDGGYDTLSGVYARRAYRRTEYHNTLLIDGAGQCGYDGRYWPRGQITSYQETPGFVASVGDGSRCYGVDGVIDRCTRSVFFRQGQFPYLVVIDDVEPDGQKHAVTWNFVAHPEVVLSPADGGWYELAGSRASLQMRVVSQTPLVCKQDLGGTMPRLQATTQAVRSRFASILIPMWPDLTSWAFGAEFDDDSVRVSVELNGVEEIWTIGTNGVAND